jgi:hypothetical protein
VFRRVLLSVCVWALAAQGPTPDLEGTTPAKDFAWLSTAKDMGKDGWWVEHFIHNKVPGSVKVVWYTSVCDTWLGHSDRPVSLGIMKGGAIQPRPVNGFIEIDKAAKKPARYYYFPADPVAPDQWRTSRLENDVQLTVRLADKYQTLHVRTRSEVQVDRLHYTIQLREKELAAHVHFRWTAWSDAKEAEVMRFTKGSFEDGYFKLVQGETAFSTAAASYFSVRSGKLVVFDRDNKELGAIVSPALRAAAKKGAK